LIAIQAVLMLVPTSGILSGMLCVPLVN
jgi:hypothetical protein